MENKIYELTNPQKSIWLTEQFYNGTCVNNICGTMIIHDKVDFSKLKQAICTFVKYNDAFRLNFIYDNNEIKQQILSTLEFDVTTIDVSNNEELLSLENKIVSTPFDVSRILFNFTMFRFCDGTGGFVICMHHLISDACTASLVANKIINIYTSLLKNEEVLEPTTSYTNYINAENNYLVSNKFEKDKQYWNTIFDTPSEIGNIPSIKQEDKNTCVAERKTFILSKEQLQKINTFCSKNKISAFNFFMALYAIYVGKVSGLNDFVLGTPILNRSTYVEKNTPGMFISTVPFRFVLTDSLSFIDFVKKIASDSLSMLRHQKYPYQNILEDIRKKNPSQPNLYDILISYQNTKTNRNNSEIPYEVRWAFNNNLADSMQIHLFDLNDQGILNISYDYRLDKYTEDEICAIHNRICHMIDQVLACNDLLIKDTQIVTPEEKNVIINKFNNTSLDYDKTKTVVDYFEEQVLKVPNNIALVCNDIEFTYKELNEKANQLANYLIKNNVKQKDIVGIMVQRSPEMIIGLLAILKVGACYLPIDPEYPTDRILYMLEDSNCKTILLHNYTFNLINEDYNKIDISLDSSIYTSNEIQNLNVKILPNDLIYMIYTSGSTGNPKGVMLTHQNVNNFIIAEKQYINFSQEKVMLSVTTICFDIFVLEIWCSLSSGMKIVVANDLEQMTPNLIRKLCQKHNVNMIQTTPSRFSTLLKNKYKLDFFNDFTDIMVGGEAFPKTLLENLKKHTNANIFNMYGPTETTVWSTIKDLTHTSDITVGNPIGNTTCYILDKNKNLLPPYVAGELYIGGDGVSAGYWNRKELTNEKFISSPFKENEIIYNTNDLAYFTNEGEIVHLGRTDFQVKIRGHRIELEGIENKIIKYENIIDCVVKPVDNATRLCAYYISDKEVNVNDLRNYLSKQLPNYMVPNYFVKMEQFPYTPNGKINKKALPLPEINTYKKIVPARNDFDEYIILKLQTYIGVENISITDSFFDIGGDSLTAINLATKLSNKYHIKFSVRDILETPIIKDMSDSVSSKITSNFNIPLTKVKDKEYYNISSAQKRMYYTSKISGEKTTLYNMPGSIIFDKKPDINKLNECFNKLIQRHSSLRTYFEIIDENVYQKVLNNVSFEVVEKIEENKTIDEILKDFVKPFDLAKAPLFRVNLVTLKDKFVLLFDMHHIISDGLSLSILTTELCKLYNEEELPQNTFEYIDYSEWEYKNLKENSMRDDKDYWINQFKENIPVLNMPTDYIRPSMQSFEGEKVYKTISSDLSRKITSLSKKLDVSNYMLLLSCYYILLSKYTNQEDIVVGSPVLGRDKEELLNMIGMFVNSLPLRNHIDSSMSFNEFLNTVKTNFIDALSHQNYPFDELVNNLNITRDNSRNPLFDTMFIYQNNGFAPLNFKGIVGKYYLPDTKISKFDLSLEVVPTENEFKLNFEYCTKLFNKNTIERFSEHFINILTQIVDNYEQKISDIDILSEDERNKILYEFNDTKTIYPKDKTIIELFEEQAKKTPDNIAVVFENEKLTYKELNEKANSLAWHLRKIGLKRNDIVSIMLNRSLELIVSILGVLKSGACYIPIDPNYPKDRTQYMLENSNSKILLTDTYLYDTINFNNKLIVDLSNFNFEENKTNLPNINEPDDISYIIYTSGSTGKPKGVVLKQLSLTNLTYYLNDYVCFLKENKYISMASVTTASFDIFIFETLIALQKGLKVAIANEDEQRLPTKLNLFIKNNDIKAIQMTPSRMRMFVDAINDCPNLSNLEYVVLAGEPLPDSLLRDLLNIGIKKVYNGYGPSETTVFSTFTDVTNYPIVNIGKPLSNTQMYILDKNLSPVPIGHLGELYIAGDGVGKGYLNNEKITNERFIENPFVKNSIMYKTGDICKFLDNGEIAYIERIDNQVKIRGLRIELEEIENKLLEFPFIKKAKIVKQSIENRDFISAYYVATTTLKTNEIRKFLSTSLPDYMIPSYFTALEDFPYTPNGKIDKNALPLPNISLEDNPTEYIAPRNNTETALVSLLEKILKVSHISVLDNFFNLGGDSLTAIVLCTNIKQKFNIELSFKDVIHNPIIEDLAIVIANKKPIDNYSYIKTCTKREYYPTSSAQKRMYLSSSADNNSTLYNVTGGILLDSMPDVKKLQNIFNTIIKRHDSLRTYFEVIDGNIVQKIVENLDVELNVENVNTNDINELFGKYQSIFDLNKPPLFKVFLLNMPNSKVLLMLDVHHIIFDGASLNNLIKEVSTLYNEKDLPKLDISYKDFAVWEEEQLLNDGFKNSKEYWINQFADDIPILNMPTTYARGANKNYEGTTFEKILPKEFSYKINNFASKYNVTPYMLMLCAYYILLYKYTNQEDIVVGSPISGRPYSELEPLLGMFVNSMPLKANISSSAKFNEFLTNVKDNCVNAFAHQDYPFDVLVNDLNIARDSSRNPLFDTMFIYQNNGFNKVDLNGINAHICSPTSHTSKFDISLEVVPIDNELKLSFEYCIKLFDEEFIRNFARHYENILNTILEQPEVKIADICMLSEEEKNKILFEFNDTKLDYPNNKTIANLFEEQAQKTPNNIALVFEDKKLTYKELNEKSNQLANYLKKQGVKEGDIIGIMLPRSLEVLISILGVLKTGACYIPIDPALPSTRINYMISNSNVNILLSTDAIPSDINVNNALDVRLNNETIYSGNCNNLNIKVNQQSPSYMIYTSGSTGTPKGVVLNHKALVNLTTYLNNTVEFLKDEYANIAIASITTISFDIFIFETLICLQKGLKIVMANEAEQNTPNLLDELITKNDVKAIQMTPSRMYIFINNKNLMPHLNNLKYVVLAGEALPKDLLCRILELGNIKVYNGYGPSETTVFSTFTDVTNYEEITIGKPLGNTRIYILDKDMNICPTSNPGEIYIAGDGVGIGYSNNEEMTKERFVQDIFYPNEIMYKTGDLAKYLPNGEIHYIGRVDNQIKIRGLRIELDEIENCILKYPNIEKCIITADTDSNHRQFIVAYLCVNDRISVNKLRMFLKNMLPKYMVPSYFIILDKLPYLNNGKINKKALPKPEINKSNLEKANYTAPSNTLEQQIADIFQSLLSISPIGIDDNFFELGGDSLLAINLQVELLKLNLNITYSDIFMKPTIRELAKKISSNEISTFNSIDTNEFLGFNTVLDNTCNLPKKLETKELGNVLITGTTGFLGAHVLDNFLKVEKGVAYCLVRPEPGLTLENKLIKKLHFYFGDKYDKYIGNRIVIVNADIALNNLGLSNEELERIANDISCIINCAAKVSHFGNYNDYKKINVTGCENLLKFCYQFNKRFYQVSTLSVSGNSLVDQSYMEQSFENDVIFRENNFYINQSLDNVYVRSKFEAEKLVLKYILKGLDAYILRVGNLMSRYEDGKFQPNVDENAYLGRLLSLANIKCIPDYMLNTYMEFTPIDSCSEAIIKLAKHPSKENRIFHLYDHNHVDVDIFIKTLRDYISFDIVSNDEFINKIDNIFKQENSNKILSGILRDFDANRKLVYESKVKLKSDFTIEYLSKIGFEWPNIDEKYLIKFLDYFCSIGYVKKEK